MGQKLTDVTFYDRLAQTGDALINDVEMLRFLARKALSEPQALTHTEIQQIGFALLVATRDANAPLHGSGSSL